LPGAHELHEAATKRDEAQHLLLAEVAIPAAAAADNLN
jgi:hypothetical protein